MPMVASRSQRFRRASEPQDSDAATVRTAIEYQKERPNVQDPHLSLSARCGHALQQCCSWPSPASICRASSRRRDRSTHQIRITFSEAVVPRFSGIELKDQSGKLIATGQSETDRTDKKILVVPVKEQLAPGDYKVEWHAVSEDTHRVKGPFCAHRERPGSGQ
jgi:hypothetical protein